MYVVDLGCFGKHDVTDEGEALELIRMHYPAAEIYSWHDATDPAIGESPIYEDGDQGNTDAIGTVYRRPP